MTRSEGRFWGLIVGIDAYRAKPLHGCVNDADAVRRLLVERAGVPPEDLRCLVSPHPDASRPAGREEPATLANLQAALAELAGRAQDGDRVFIYYSGHGVRVPAWHPGGHFFHREALAPVDVHEAPERRLLFDHEVNQLLVGIAGSVTCIFDCCHSAGVTRDPWMLPRSLDPSGDLGLSSPLQAPPSEPARSGLARGLDDCHVVAACLAHELAMETRGKDGLTHGVLSSAFLHALEKIPDPELRTVRWSRIWQEMRAAVASRNPWQHPWMAGHRASPVLTGDLDRGDHAAFPQRGVAPDADLGLAIRGTGGAYEIDAGTLALVTQSALIAVYGEEPDRFPALGSGEDLAARHGLLRVTSAQLGSAIAELCGAPFELPPGARGRIVELGRAPRLRCAILPPDEAIAARLSASPLIELVGEPQAQVRLEQRDGRWLLTDDVHDPAGPLIAVRPESLEHVRELLEHYYRYALPLRMAEAADLPGALRLSVLACTRRLSAAEAQEANLPEAPSTAASTYDVQSGTRICFRVHNTSSEYLRVTLVNSASSGRVQILGDQVIDPSAAYTFWFGNELGRAFEMSVPRNMLQGIDRLTAIGTTAMARDLRYLHFPWKFSKTLKLVGVKDINGEDEDDDDEDDDLDHPPIERWAATQAIVRTCAK